MDPVVNTDDESDYEETPDIKKAAPVDLNTQEGPLPNDMSGGVIVHDVNYEAMPTSFDLDSEEIELTNYRLSTFDDAKEVLKCKKLSALILRQNRIGNLEGIEQLKDTLTYLDLYENQLTKSSYTQLGQLTNLKYLDLSFNELRVVDGLQDLKKLESLYLINNKIKIIHGLYGLGDKLELLELGSNRIRKIENLDHLVHLKELYLGRNKITEITGLDSLIELEKISFQANRLISVGTGLSNNINLKELYLGQNGIHKITGLETLVNLTILDIGHNHIKELPSLKHLLKLTDIWANNNEIANWKNISSIKDLVMAQEENKCLSLDTLYFEGNPIHADLNYKQKVLALAPKLHQLDSMYFEYDITLEVIKKNEIEK